MKNLQTPILSIETSGENCGAALFRAFDDFAETNFHRKNVHSEILLDTIDTVLNLNKLKTAQLKAVAVSIGPGSFTGLRIGLAAAKGLALGSDLPIIPVPTFDALALQLALAMKTGVEFTLAKKVNSTEHYVATFRKKNNEIEKIGNITVMKTEELINRNNAEILFSEAKIEGAIPLPPLRAFSVAYWAYLFGKDLLTFDYDFLEPEYFKNFIPKVKK